MTFWKWSRTASANATADSTCPFPEGMPPSAVNDGVRGLMAAAAKYRDDMSGALISAGTASAYTLSTNQGFTAPIADGTGIVFYAHATNAAGATINVDGTGAVPLMAPINQALPAGVVVAGTPYKLRYTTIPGWILEGLFGQPYAIPIGGFLPYLSTTPPNSSFVLPFNQPVSRSAYATLFSMIGTTFGVGDGSTTFNLPDLRGRVIAGMDNMGGTAIGRLTTVGGGGLNGVVLGSAGGGETAALAQAHLPAVAPSFSGIPDTVTVNSTRGDIVLGATGNSISLDDVPRILGTGSGGVTSQGTFTPRGTISNLGSGAGHANVQPTMVLPWLLRVI